MTVQPSAPTVGKSSFLPIRLADRKGVGAPGKKGAGVRRVCPPHIHRKFLRNGLCPTDRHWTSHACASGAAVEGGTAVAATPPTPNRNTRYADSGIRR